MDLRERRQTIDEVPVLVFWFQFRLHDLQKTRLGSDWTSSETSSNPKIRFRGTKKQKIRKRLMISTYSGSPRTSSKFRISAWWLFLVAKFACMICRKHDWVLIEHPVKHRAHRRYEVLGTKKQKLRNILRFSKNSGSLGRPKNNRNCVCLALWAALLVCKDITYQRTGPVWKSSKMRFNWWFNNFLLQPKTKKNWKRTSRRGSWIPSDYFLENNSRVTCSRQVEKTARMSTT